MYSFHKYSPLYSFMNGKSIFSIFHSVGGKSSYGSTMRSSYYFQLDSSYAFQLDLGSLNLSANYLYFSVKGIPKILYPVKIMARYTFLSLSIPKMWQAWAYLATKWILSSKPVKNSLSFQPMAY